MRARRRGLVLPVVLVLIGLLSLIMGGYTFFVQAESSGIEARRNEQQARLTAESGMTELGIILRESQHDPTMWWDVPETFRHVLVWSPEYMREEDPVRKMGSREEILAEPQPVPAWRYSVVGRSLDGLPDTMRYGVTPESSKLNINYAEESEIRRLLEDVLIDLQLENWGELVDALLDWMDEDDEPRQLGAESDYYNMLVPGYYAKNGKLDTIEELLMVKGFSAAVLYGEDVNRNGILDPNEDDTDATFPFYDNGDGQLQHGLAPYITVWSREQNDEGQMVGGGVNVNTAPIRVLQALEGMSLEGAESIVALRQELDGEALQDINWVVSQGALEPGTFDAVKDKLTVQANQFHVELLVYADHTKLGRRYEYIIEMRGPYAQVVYFRDLTRLGLAWPIDEDTFVTTR